jgi:hypothetical protein
MLVVLGITMAASGFGFSLLNGLGAASQAALNADVLPKNSDNAARDMQLIQTTPVLLPGILIPLVVGSAWGSLGARPYHVLYTGAACVACVALVVLWNIPVDGDEDTRSATHRAGRQAPTASRGTVLRQGSLWPHWRRVKQRGRLQAVL